MNVKRRFLRPWRFTGAVLACLLPAILAAESDTRPAESEKIEYGKPKKLCDLANRKIGESSGLACSRLRDGVFWTHNDSGDRPQIYAFDTDGKDLATFEVKGAEARDWEDMASFSLGKGKGKRSFLLLADVGDNARNRKTCRLYIVPEPAIGKSDKPVLGTTGAAMKIDFAYEDGPHDCESVAVDTGARKIYLASKESPLKARIYELPLPNRSTTRVLKAKAVANIPILFATAMDISPDGLRAVILTYAAAHEFTRKADQTWAQGFSQPPRTVKMP
ncbi:MAG TPA: hypothetical protein VMZ50_06530, partial [Phycisphaerae bacterium]|nr:hypothetical protein [Phycisphaerae bacterium]